MPRTKSKSIPASTNPKGFPVIAVGAGLGGELAFAELISHLPSGLGMAVCIYQQWEDESGAWLRHLSEAARLPVIKISTAVTLMPDQVYIIPNGNVLEVENGTLSISPVHTSDIEEQPISHFLNTIAETFGEYAIGILLSGDSSDGAAGLAAIKVAGGLTFVQNSSAEYKNMAKNAIQLNVADLELSIPAMADEIIKISNRKAVYYSAIAPFNEDAIADDNEILTNVLGIIYRISGVDFSQYKLNTIKRRLLRRMMLVKTDTLEEYGEYIRHHPAESNLLYQDFLINVTTFFRDAEVAGYLQKHLLPKIIKSKSGSGPIRIWVPACSFGQEAYSLAIMLTEALGSDLANTPVQIFATDISDIAITKARQALYTRSDLPNVSSKRLQRFFTKTDGHYRVIKSIRELCVFARHNVLKDPPFSRLDLISCCNLLIYLEPPLQKKLIATFNYSLQNNGYLVLGRSETIGPAANMFSQTEKKYKIYSKKLHATSRALFDMNYRNRELRLLPDQPKTEAPPKSNGEAVLQKVVDSVILDRFTPASVIVNKDLDILQFRGSTGMYLEPAPGKASLNLLKMARPGLSFELRNIVHKAFKTGESASRKGIEVVTEGKMQRVGIEAIPLKTETEELYYLVLFSEEQGNGAAQVPVTGKDRRVRQLEAELQQLKEDMRSIVESQEAANEELQSANEEIVSSNEELQSINEELETSKEEIESSNEELITINQELQVRNEQLAEVQEYAESVFTTIRESLLILDKDLRIKSANNAFYKTFHTNEGELLGQMLFEVNNRQWNIPQLKELLEKVLPRLQVNYGYEIQHTFAGIGEKILLINSCQLSKRSNNEQLILLAIEDITEHRQAQRIISEKEAWFRNAADNAPVMIWMAGTDQKFTFVNKTWLEYTGLKLKDAVNREWTEWVHPDDREQCIKTYNSSFAEKKPFMAEFRMLRNDGEYRWLLNKAKSAFSPEGVFTGYIGSCVEVHDQRLINQELENRVEQRTLALVKTNSDLERSNSELNQFAYVASHDLQEPLRKINTFIDRLREDHMNEISGGARKYFDKINDSSRRMSHLIDDLLDFARITRHNNRLERISLNDIMEQLKVDLEILIHEKEAVISTHELPEVYGVKLQLAQLFYNLLNNSLKFSKPGIPAEITITGSQAGTADYARYPGLLKDIPYHRIGFADNGIGFDQQHADEIFTIFNRLHDSKHYPGTGIGLALCKKIVQGHNGHIYAQGKPGEGAVFTVFLPVLN